jgi:hypothetical protein
MQNCVKLNDMFNSKPDLKQTNNPYNREVSVAIEN